MAKIKEVIGAGLFYTGMWAGIGGVAGGVIDLGNHFSVKHDINSEKQAIEHDQNTIVTADKNIHEIRVRLGETCLVTITPYTKGNRLGDVVEDKVLDDLTRNPAEPCGTNPTEVRQKIRDVRENTTNLLDAQADLSKQQEALAKDLEDQKNDGNFNGLLVGSLILSIPGLMRSAFGPGDRHSLYNDTVALMRNLSS